MRQLRGVVAARALCCVICVLAGLSDARAQNHVTDFIGGIDFKPLNEACAGDCYVQVYGGPYLATTILYLFGIGDFKADTSGDSFLVAFTTGRKLYGYGSLWQVDAEAGVGQRFGLLDSTEVWGAFYFRWLYFPWNHIVRTSFSVSTGLNYAFERDAVENRRADNGGRGSNLLHFLSPEIAFGLPRYPNIDLVVRAHHRSGGNKSGLEKISRRVFNSSAGGANYLTFGFRRKF